MKYFLDTNIILDYFICNREHHEAINTLLREVHKNDDEAQIWIDRDSISTIDYIMRKETTRADVVSMIINSFNIANNIDVLSDAINFSKKHRADYEDIVKVMTADKTESVVFLTHDKKLLSFDAKFDINIMNIESMLIKFGYQKDLFGNYTLGGKTELPNDMIDILDIMTEEQRIKALTEVKKIYEEAKKINKTSNSDDIDYWGDKIEEEAEKEIK